MKLDFVPYRPNKVLRGEQRVSRKTIPISSKAVGTLAADETEVLRVENVAGARPAAHEILAHKRAVKAAQQRRYRANKKAKGEK